MKASLLFFPTLRQVSDAELVSHKLMLRAGMIRKLGAGLYTWLPLGIRVLHKVTSIIHQEMQNIGAQELLMPAVQPAELWQATNRWQKFGPTLLKMQDRNKRDFCFGPTHEEVVTALMRNELNSYKQLPLCVYQVQTKFRDEIRPRFGVMRAREFLMKDAYSFHLTSDSLEQTYQDMLQAYTKIFDRLQLDYKIVFADPGDIGGTKSQEFHALAAVGEDELAVSSTKQYAANVELAPCTADKYYKQTSKTQKTTVTTPNIVSVAEQAKHLQIKTSQIVKTILVKGSNDPVVAILLRGDHLLNHFKAARHELIASPCELINQSQIQQVANCDPGFVGPIGLEVPIIADQFIANITDFSCGANKNDHHYLGVNWHRDLPLPEFADLKIAESGDVSPDGGTYSMTRGIELGHIFQLGDKYSKDLAAKVLDQNGKERCMLMGCYGIGVSRIVAALIEQNHDEHGIIWPHSVAPFQVAIIPIAYHTNSDIQQLSLQLYDKFSPTFSTLLDDRKLRPGAMFKDHDLIGSPQQIVISEKHLAARSVEYKQRATNTTKIVPLNQIYKLIEENLCT